MMAGIKEWVVRKIYYAHNMVKEIFNEPKIGNFDFFFKSIHQIFLTLYPITGSEHWVKV